MKELTVLSTSVAGLDDILLGGVPRGNIILLQGVTGSGKTLIVYRGIVEFDEPGLIVVFETSPNKLIRDAAKFGWNLDKLQQEKKRRVVFTSPHVFEQELRSADSLLLESAAEIGAQRIFIDGMGLLDQNASEVNSEPFLYRDLFHQLIETFYRESLTAVLSHEISKTAKSLALSEAAEFFSDTVIRLNRGLHNRRSQRMKELSNGSVDRLSRSLLSGIN
jgi:circadian clock protein KaiC